MHVLPGRRLGALVSDSPRPEDPHPNPLPRGEGERAGAASRTLGVYKSLRRKRAGVSVLVAGDVAKLLGPAATLTPALSLKGEGGRGARPLIDGAGPESGLGFAGRFDRKTPHRFRPKTPEPASPPGEGKDRRRPLRSVGTGWGCGRPLTPFLFPGRGIRADLLLMVAGDVARLLGPAATLTPALSLKGEGGRGVSPRRSWLRTQVLAAEGREQRRRRSSGEGSGGA